MIGVRVFRVRLSSLVVVLVTLSTSLPAFAQNKYWSKSTAGNFNESFWSNTSGVPNTLVPPTSTETAVFDATGTSDCTITAGASVAGIDIRAGYAGTVTLNSTIPFTPGNNLRVGEPPETGLVAYWKLDETTGPTAADLTPRRQRLFPTDPYFDNSLIPRRLHRPAHHSVSNRNGRALCFLYPHLHSFGMRAQPTCEQRIALSVLLLPYAGWHPIRYSCTWRRPPSLPIPSLGVGAAPSGNR